MTTFKTGSTLTSGVAVTDTATAFQITFNASHSAGQAGFQATDYLNAPIFVIVDASNGLISTYGDYLGSRKSLADDGNVRVEGRRNPAPFEFPDGIATRGMRIWSGTGAPSAGSTVPAGRTVTDMVTNGTTTITSASAVFTAAFDQQLHVTGTNIPDNTTISTVTNGTTAVLSAAASGSGSGGTLNIAIPQIGDLYINRTGSAGTYVYEYTTVGVPGTWTAIK